MHGRQAHGQGNARDRDHGAKHTPAPGQHPQRQTAQRQQDHAAGDAVGQQDPARTQADTEFLARELASVRLALADVVTHADLGDRLDHLEKLIIDRLPAG